MLLPVERAFYARFKGTFDENLKHSVAVARKLLNDRIGEIRKGKFFQAGKISESNTLMKYKVIRSGHIIEVYRYEHGVSVGHQKGGRKKKEEGRSENFEHYRADTLTKNRNRIRRLINMNFRTNAKFVTLTFRDTQEFDIRSLSDCNPLFEYFIKRLKYYLKTERGHSGSFAYVAVAEFQDRFSRGAVHYHIVMDIPYVPWDRLAEIWGHGFIGIEAIEYSDNIGAYMAKYITKKADDERYIGRKSYFTSRGLNKPQVTYCNSAPGLLDLVAEKRAVYVNTYGSDILGSVNYHEYNLKRNDTTGLN